MFDVQRSTFDVRRSTFGPPQARSSVESWKLNVESLPRAFAFRLSPFAFTLP
jgi:hypothetical protein